MGVYWTGFLGFMEPSGQSTLDQPVVIAAEQIVQKNILVNLNEESLTFINNQKTLQSPAGKTIAAIISNQLGIYIILPDLISRIRANEPFIIQASQQLALINAQEAALIAQSTRMVSDAIQLLAGFEATFQLLNNLSGQPLLAVFDNLIQLENLILTMIHLPDRLLFVKDNPSVQSLFTPAALELIDNNVTLIENMRTLALGASKRLNTALFNLNFLRIFT